MKTKQSMPLTFAAFVVLMVGLGSSDSLRGIFSTIFQQHFGLTATQVGLIVTVSYIGNLVFLLVGGNISQRFAKKRVLQTLMLLWMAALALFAFTDSYPVLLGAMVIIAGCPSAVMVTVLAIQYGRDAEYSSKGILLNTVLSMVTMPALVYFRKFRVK